MTFISLIRRIMVTLFLAISLTANSQNKGPRWLENAVFYQIYPSSYMDSNGDGYGDLPGITSKLDYIKSLGVNAIWLNPIFRSGWFDGGYDVIDFYEVDSRFGTNTDLVTLVKESHKRGLKVCLDLVAGHTSDKCAWFKESGRKDSNLRYSDYYIWTDNISEKDKEDVEKRRHDPIPAASRRGLYVEANLPRAKYYEKNYYECQPALNYGFANHDPEHPWEQGVDAPGPQAVRREIRNIMSFWLDKGIDGFRVDMASSLVKNDPDKKETSKLWQEMRRWKDKNYPEAVFISEWSNPAQAIPAGFNIDFMIHFGMKGYPSLFFAKGTPYGNRNSYDYCYFDKSGKGQSAEFINNFSKSYNVTKDLGYIAIPSANHDFQRLNVGSRNSMEQLKVAMTFFLTMPGVPFIYYGDEIGMKYQTSITPKEGSNERAGSRTPMQWDNSSTAGFSTCAPDKLYFPVDTDNGKLTVEAQQKDPKSLLQFVRNLLSLRHSSVALRNDGIWTLLSDENNPYPMVYSRTSGDEKYIIAINPSSQSVNTVITSQGRKANICIITGKASYKSGNNVDVIKLDGISAAVYKIIM